MGYVVEEADESIYWLEMIEATGIAAGVELKPLLAESNELSRIFNQSQLTAKTNAAARQRR
jgi:hypothetical protein